MGRDSIAQRRADVTRRVHALLRAELVAGTFDGDMLPTEEELRAEFGASRSSIRDALALLRKEGLIDRLQGVGTLATGSRLTLSLHELHGVEDPAPDGIWAGRMRTRILDWRDVPAASAVARGLSAEIGEQVLRIDYVALLGDEVLGGATNYMRYPEASVLQPEMLRADWYAMLESAGLVVGESTFLIEAAISDDHDAELFGMGLGLPMMLMEQVIYDPDGRAFDFAFLRTRGDSTSTFSRARRGPA